MTTRDQARRTFRRAAEPGRDGAGLDDGRPSLPEILAAAREAKGVDLYRAERDTKIRARYLAALEHGDYADLPGTVYTKGFLRNYAQYLGLNPDDVLEQWRRERGNSQPPQAVVVPPQPIRLPREGITLSPNLLAIGLLLLVVGGVTVFIGSRLLPYLQPPTITVDHPGNAIETVKSTDTSYTFTGTANPGATILITADSQDLEPFLADANGRWTFKYNHLHLGTNIFSVQATNPDTNRKSDVVERQINVPAAEKPSQGVAPTLNLLNPADGASFTDGTIRVSGTTTGAAKVTISAQYEGAPVAPAAQPSGSAKPSAAPTPTPTPTPRPTATPLPTATPSGSGPAGTPAPGSSPSAAPATVPVATDGTFDTTYALTPGKWLLTVTAANQGGVQQSVTRTINVQYKGIQVVVRIKGGSAWLRVWKDGALDTATTDKVYRDGSTFTVTANQSVWIRTGVASFTYVTVNGQEYQLDAKAVSGSWRLEPGKPPKPSND